MGANVIHFPHASATCATCPWLRSCGVHAGDDGSLSAESLAQRCSVPTKRGQHVYRQGEPLEYVYVLRSGSARSYFDSSDGLEQTVAFHFPGDVLGCDALADGFHASSVVALETAALCRLPVNGSDAAFADIPDVLAALTRASARQMREQHQHVLMLGQKTALARFAGFLLDLSNRYGERGCSRVEFNLSMPRQDIANYLSLAVETVSRLFGELQGDGVIEVDRRNVRIRSLEALAGIAGDLPGGNARRNSL